MNGRIIDITNFNAPELDIYARLNEPQLRRIYEPKRGIFICESPKVIERALNAGYEAESLLVEKGKMEGEVGSIIRRCKDVPIYTAEIDVLQKLTGYTLTQGILCAMKRRALPEAEELCRDAKRVVVLEDIENPTNVGAIFRSAAALQMDAVILTEGCSDPLYRRAARVSMGSIFQIPWTYCYNDKMSYTELLHMARFKLAAMALNKNAISIDNPKLMEEERIALIFGNEENGLCVDTVKSSDYVVKIPMAADVDSLNVASASAVAFWQLRKR